jgi:hypothetical protein
MPYARNARTHSEAQVAHIVGSMREFGFINPVLRDGANGILAGHGAAHIGTGLVNKVNLVQNLADSPRRFFCPISPSAAARLRHAGSYSTP